MIRRGVTLVEALVGLALAALVAVAAQSLVVHAYRTSQVLEADSRAAMDHRFPVIWLEQDLRAATTKGDLQLRENVLTLGTLNTLNPNCESRRRAVLAQYKLKNGRLMRREREMDADENAIEAALATDVERLHFSVFDGRTWNTDWPPVNFRQAMALRIQMIARSSPAIDETIPLAPLQWSRHHE